LLNIFQANLYLYSRVLPQWQATRCASAFCFRRSLSSTAGLNSDDVDVAIVGGGPVGLAIACSLASGGDGNVATSSSSRKLRVRLLEAGKLPSSQPAAAAAAPDGSFSNRAVALSPSTVAHLRRLGAWNDADPRIAPVRGMRVVESDSDAALTFDAAQIGGDVSGEGALAYVTELAPVVSRLVGQAAKAGAQLRDGCRLESIDGDNSFDRQPFLHLRLTNKSSLRTRLLIGCDGFSSPVRKLAGIEAVDVPYPRHKAMVATLEIDGPDGLNGEAFQRFLPDGPIALLPLPGRFASLVWCSKSDRISHLIKTSDREFLADLNRCLATGPAPAAPLVTAVQADSRASFPLGFMHANRYASGRIVLAGDAAHRLSPLAGQGMNLGMEDAACLSRLLLEAASNGADPADPAYLLDYETQRQRQTQCYYWSD
uniref:FAD_binding_3 domain-containing protein n=1 Tax=Macrostomum lignano TaxID=282301 RepID=A0A1I8JDP7_9PLAT